MADVQKMKRGLVQSVFVSPILFGCGVEDGVEIQIAEKKNKGSKEQRQGLRGKG